VRTLRSGMELWGQIIARAMGGAVTGVIAYQLAGSVLATVGAVVVGVVAPLLVARLLHAAWWLIALLFGIGCAVMGVMKFMGKVPDLPWGSAIFGVVIGILLVVAGVVKIHEKLRERHHSN